MTFNTQKMKNNVNIFSYNNNLNKLYFLYLVDY